MADRRYLYIMDDIMDAEWQKHQSLFARGRVALVDFFIQDPTELAAFVHNCWEACKE